MNQIISLTIFLLIWIWTTGVQTQDNQEIEEFLETHPRKNLGLTAKYHPHHHHHNHNHHHHNHKNDLKDQEENPSKLEPRDFASFRERRKRHNTRHSKGVEYKQMTSDEERDFQESRKRGAVFLEKSEDYEVEVKEAQNNSICDYKVVPIPDLEGNRIPAELEHVVCNHAGSRCQDMGFYYCLQTYRIIDVYHGHRRSKMKIYAGCVCALFDFPVVQPQSPRLPLDDYFCVF